MDKISDTERKNRMSKEVVNNFGSHIKIIEYNSYNDITVEFDNEYITKATYGSFKIGNIKSPYCKSVYGIGYLGEGKYKTIENGVLTKPYEVWRAIIKRCYSLKEKEKCKSYKDVTCCEEWLDYQNFAQWFDDNYYEVDNGKMHLDKDILIKGNKIYSPKTCIFVPQRINELFIKAQSRRGKCPIGVNYNKRNKNYIAEVNGSIDGKRIKILRSTCSTPEEAFYKYKIAKENYIKQVADEYKERIPIKLYDAMNSYTIEITD